VRRLLNAAKAGHTGSLDPLATGLLPLCFGEATKVAGLLLGSHKAYEAECQLGVTTNTDDREGEVLQQRPLPQGLDVAAVEAALAGFVGDIQQVPPAFSAIKRDGVPMYQRARRGESLELEPRTVQIHALQCLSLQGDRLRFRVECGSGTYIRSLARDLGERLGCGAHLTALRRLWVDPFRQPVMVKLEQLEAMEPGARDACLLPVDAGLQALPAVHLDAARSHALAHGQSVPSAAEPGSCRVYGADGRLLALGEVRADARLYIRRGFNLPA
jgi:tRNA pseudouridine55 synthase